MIKKFCFALCIACCVFAGCNKDDDDNTSSVSSISATVQNGSSYDIDEVIALIDYDENIHGDWVGEEIAKVPFTNGQFSFSLPATVDNKHLVTLPNYIEEEFFDVEVKISDPAAKGTDMVIVGYKSGAEMGEFNYCKETENYMCYAMYIYVDRDVNITGEYSNKDGDSTYEFKCNMILKKGWNIVYYIDSVTESTYLMEWTTKAQSGLKWEYREYPGSKSSMEASGKRAEQSSFSIMNKRHLTQLFK